MLDSPIRGWRAGAARAGLAPSTLRRLVARGVVTATKTADGCYGFAGNDLDRLRTQSPEPAIVSGEVAYRASAKLPRETVVVPPPRPAIVNDSASLIDDSEVRTILAAAARERALTELRAAEVERLRAEQARDELVRVRREELRTGQIDRIVAKSIPPLADLAREPIERALRERLADVVDLSDRLDVGTAIARAFADVRSRAEATARASAERAAQHQQRQAATWRRQAWRNERVRGLVADLVTELHGLGYQSNAIEHAADVVSHQLGQLDDATLNGASWPAFVVRWNASAALGLQPPEPPAVWHAFGWRSIQPGE